MRIAFLLGVFPAVSETFVLRQITGLINQGHEVDIYSENRPEKAAPLHEEIERYGLLSRTVYVNEQIPEASGYWELPALPVSGETWIPGASEPIPNRQRIAEAAPHLMRCLSASPELAFDALDPEQYGISARSLSALYRLSILAANPKKYDVVHAHFGPTAKTFRFARALWKAPLVATFHGYDFSMVPKQEG